MQEVNIIEYLLQVAPAVGVLGWWIFSLKEQIKAQREELIDERKYSREQDKDNLTALNGMVKALDQLLKEGKEVNRDTIQAIKETAESTAEKIINHIDKTQ
jgi:Fic family protein